ncbi:MAG: anti-sigma factor [Actinobacteria bacterium]|nr:MAG: anti-sigma factor [Actinomycetota bacterium]
MEHDHSPLAAYALGALDPDEARSVDAHIAGCDECRAELAELTALEAALGEVPPEAFLDGPPDADLMLQRTLRQVRAERAQEVARVSRPRRLLVAAGVVALVGAALAGGTVFGRTTAPAPQAVGSPSAPVTTTPPGTRALAGVDPRTGTSLTGVVVPAAGWVRVHVKVTGVSAGVRCRLEVVPRSGAPVQAGSWLVSPLGEKNGTTLDGAALVAPADVASVDIVTVDGQKLVSVPV